jgi:hypothetical protein
MRKHQRRRPRISGAMVLAFVVLLLFAVYAVIQSGAK